MVHDSAQVRNLVPFTQLAMDLARNTLPHYAFIVPNLCNDAHDCPLRTADEWLKWHIDPLVQSETFRQDGLLIIVFDESRTDGDSNAAHGGCSPFLARDYQVKMGLASCAAGRSNPPLPACKVSRISP